MDPIVIEKIIAGGLGLGRRRDGLVVMAPRVLPGERVRLRETRRYRGHVLAEPVEILQTSPHRCSPPCPHFGQCGGCALQHAAYDCQLKLKQAILEETLARFRLRPEKEPVRVLASAKSEGYRHRLRVHLDGGGSMGLYRAGSHRVIPVEKCLLAPAGINQALRRLAPLGPELAPWCREVEISMSPLDKKIVLAFRQDKKPPPSPGMIDQLRHRFPDQGLALVRKNRVRVINDPPRLRQSFAISGLTHTLSWDFRCFFQTNPDQNLAMVRAVCERVRDLAAGRPARILDLFSGMGNFAIPLALMGHQVTGVEGNPVAVADGEANWRGAGKGPGTAEFVTADVHHFLKYQQKMGSPRPDLVLLDPPRRGLGKGIGPLARLGPRFLLYLSCDPVAQARDLAGLTGSGYRLVEVIGFDLFPHTRHIESLAILERN